VGKVWKTEMHQEFIGISAKKKSVVCVFSGRNGGFDKKNSENDVDSKQ
jgi:hypothetical protein